mmetsp:Transcript_42643/g.91466  ORF Transcript_42643/g.91466 Transcript_42643/m.91466 type:complete len:84 (+) Transcript_42643:153-404(+)
MVVVARAWTPGDVGRGRLADVLVATIRPLKGSIATRSKRGSWGEGWEARQSCKKAKIRGKCEPRDGLRYHGLTNIAKGARRGI